MLPFKIGNWLINEHGIEWDGDGHDYLIGKNTIVKKGTDSRSEMYDWLVHVSTRTFLTREDVYSFNTAFIYALEIFEIPKRENMSFVQSFIEQEKNIKEQEEDDLTEQSF